jgi:hypothetical protein
MSLSLELSALQANVAALLDPSPAGFEDFRCGLAVFSPNLPDLKVVLIVYFSGLGVLIVFPGAGDRPGECDLMCDMSGVPGSRPEVWPLTTAPSDENRLPADGRGGRAGRDNSEYVTAGIVPCPSPSL